MRITQLRSLPALTRGLTVRLMDPLGQQLEAQRVRHDCPVGLVIARPESVGLILDALATSVLSPAGALAWRGFRRDPSGRRIATDSSGESGNAVAQVL
jgi:hypothetical protein